ncbi:acyl-CoA dehydrogenase family protein [Nocardia fluminea]|uniref:acyl-CoA dehydrogenase family protein n=1 Tax=Nocardia fluminea TaxID=134984 RepID=UPI00342AB1E6
MDRNIFDEEHESFREVARAFYEKECVPYVEEWEAQGHVTREVWRKAGAAGLLGFEADEQYGGLGVRDYRFNAIVAEEMYAVGAVGVGFTTHNNVVGPYLTRLANEDQRKRYLPGFVDGTCISAIAISEPDAGSDVARIRTTAKRDGEEYVLNGAKTFITNGYLADLVVVAAKTSPDLGHRGISLFLVEASYPGFKCGRKLDKIGLRSRDTAELFFDDVRVPAENLLGELDRGFYHLMTNLAEERLTAAIVGVASMRRAIELTTEHVRNRKVFGAGLGDLQATRFTMADVLADTMAAQAWVDRMILEVNAGHLSAEDAAAVKFWVTERQFDVLDRCLQLFGGYGYMNEYEIARLWRDGRVQRIYAGSNEVMREIVGRAMKLSG